MNQSIYYEYYSLPTFGELIVSFTPGESGYYTLYSNGDVFVEITGLFEVDGVTPYGNANYYDGNSYVSCYLEAGETYRYFIDYGHIYYGFAANTDIVTASVEAYIDAINKFR